MKLYVEKMAVLVKVEILLNVIQHTVIMHGKPVVELDFMVAVALDIPAVVVVLVISEIHF